MNLKPNLKNQENTSTFHIDKAVFIKNSPSYFNNGGFITAFTNALHEVAINPNLGKLELKLLMLILSYMGDKTMMIETNVQRLYGVQDYADILKSKKQHISTAFMKLESLGLLKRDKKRKEVVITINPNVAYSGKTSEFTSVWNQLDMFGNIPRKVEEKTEQEKQDWSSHLLEDIKAKK